MSEPARAIVAPRVTSPSGLRALLEDEVREWLDSDSRTFTILGGPGSGKTTALRHTEAAFPAADVEWIDDRVLPPSRTRVSQRVVFTSTQILRLDDRSSAHVVRRLAPWNADDVIEWLLASHPDRCGSVLDRIADPTADWIEGIPALAAVVLPVMAADDRACDSRSIALDWLFERLGDAEAASAMTHALQRVFDPGRAQAPPAPSDASAARLSRLEPVARALAAIRFFDDLEREFVHPFVSDRVPDEQGIRALADELVGRPSLLDRLTDGPNVPAHVAAVVTSALVRARPGWVPGEHACRQLQGADLRGACWPGVELAEVEMARANIDGALLDGAVLTGSKLEHSTLCATSLRGAVLVDADCTDASFAGANLADARLARARLVGADLSRARCEGTEFVRACLARTDLRGATCDGADFTRAILTSARIADGSFRYCSFDGADLEGLRLFLADFTGSTFDTANMSNCILDGMVLEAPVFTGAILTGATMTGARMRGADLSHATMYSAGLADVDWEGADLRGAVLRGASFHGGSSRCGHVGSDVASDGSRTGFYTDDFDERRFKAPEEIRKANLRGADLSGADVELVDFYLVDLRDAVYGDAQREHFERTNAILSPR